MRPARRRWRCMTNESREQAYEDFLLSIVRGDVLFRLQRKVGLIPAGGLGLVRRAIFWSLLAWVPVAVWAWMEGRAVPPLAEEPLLGHFGVQVRCLVAIPLLILAEGPAHAMTMRILPHFVRSGLVEDSQIPAFRAALAGAARVRDSCPACCACRPDSPPHPGIPARRSRARNSPSRSYAERSRAGRPPSCPRRSRASHNDRPRSCSPSIPSGRRYRCRRRPRRRPCRPSGPGSPRESPARDS